MNTSGKVFFLEKDASLRQVNSDVSDARSASTQGYRGKDASRSDHLTPDRNGLVPITIQCKRYVKERIHEIAKRESLGKKKAVSDSAIGADMLEKMVQHDANIQYSGLLEPVIASIIRAEFRAFENRFLGVISRIAYQTGQVLVLLQEYLGLIFRNDEATLDKIEEKSETAARVNVTHRSPHIIEVQERIKEEWEGDRK